MKLDSLGDWTRTHSCGELTSAAVSTRATLAGWVDNVRDFGNLIFIDLRDRDGITQVVVRADASPELVERSKLIRPEFVVAARGAVTLRSPETVNPAIKTG